MFHVAFFTSNSNERGVLPLKELFSCKVSRYLKAVPLFFGTSV